MAQVQQLYRLLISAASSLQSPFLLLIRLAWGLQMHMSGDTKVRDVAKVTARFTHLGIPLPAASAVFIAILEFVGGILFALGLGSRLIALLFTGDMLVAYITVDHDAIASIFSNTRKFYAAAPYTYLVAALIVLIFGPGKFSLDALLAKRFAGRAPGPKPYETLV
jgi:putative oxidoreductase